MCPLTYCRIEEIQEISVLEEGSQPQPRTAVPQATPKGEHKVLAPLPRPRPLKPQNDDDDISRYSRVQIIDTSFQIQKAGESKIAAGIATLSVQDLDDPECLAAYLATVCGLPEEDCLVALRECETQLIRVEFEQSLADDVEGMADVFIDDERSLISWTTGPIPTLTSALRVPIEIPPSPMNVNSLRQSPIPDQNLTLLDTFLGDALRCSFPGCGKSFGEGRRCRSSNLKRHIASVHKNYRWFCLEPECGKSYKRSDTLRNHRRKYHGLADPILWQQRSNNNS